MNKDQLYFAIRKARKKMSDKLLSEEIIVQYFELFDPEADFDIIQKYFNLHQGPLFLSDFISILMLLNHHQHINLSLGYFLEMNLLIREFEHSLFLQKIDKQEKLKLQRYNSFLEIVSPNFQKTKNPLKIDFSASFDKNQENNFSISFITKFDQSNLLKYQNQGSLNILKNERGLIFKIIDQPVDCPFFDELFEIEEFQQKVEFESNMTFEKLLNAGNTEITKKNEFSLKIRKQNWNQNLEGLFNKISKQFFSQYQNEKVLKIQQYLTSNFEGKILLDEQIKFKIIDEIFKREDNNEVNLICSFLLDLIDYSLEQTEGEKKRLIRQLARTVQDFFIASFSFHGFQFEFQIKQEECEKIFELLELKLEDFEYQKQKNLKESKQSQQKTNKELKVNDLQEFRKNFIKAEDEVKKKIQEKYSSNQEGSIYDIKSDKNIRTSQDQDLIEDKNIKKIEDLLSKTDQTFKTKKDLQADNIKKNIQNSEENYQKFEFTDKDDSEYFNQTQRKNRNETEIISRLQQNQDQIYRKNFNLEPSKFEKNKLKLQRIFQTSLAFLKLFKRIRKKRRTTFKNDISSHLVQINKNTNLFQSFANQGSQYKPKYSFRAIAFSVKIFLKLRKHVQRNNIKRIFHGFMEEEKQISRKLILKRNTIVFVAKVFVGLLQNIRKKKYLPRIRSYTGKKPLLLYGKSNKLFIRAYSIKVFLSLFKFIKMKKIKQSNQKYVNKRVYKNLQKLRIIVKTYIVLRKFQKQIKRRQTIGTEKYDRIQKVKKAIFFKIRILLIFKNMIKFTKRKKLYNLKFNLKQDLTFKLKTRVIAISSFMSLYKFVQRRRITKRKISYLPKFSEEQTTKMNIVKKKIFAINRFLKLYKFVQFKKLKRMDESFQDFDPNKIINHNENEKKFGKFHAVSISVIAFQKLYKRVEQQRLKPSQKIEIYKKTAEKSKRVKLLYLFKAVYIFKNLFKFIQLKKIKHTNQRFSKDLDYDVQKIKKYQSLGFNNYQIVKFQHYNIAQQYQKRKLSLKNLTHIVLMFQKLLKNSRKNKTKSISHKIILKQIQIDIPRQYSLKSVCWIVFGFMHLLKKQRIRKKQQTIKRLTKFQEDGNLMIAKRTIYPKMFAFSKFCQILQNIRMKKQAVQNRKKNIRKLKIIVQVIMMFQSFYKEIKKQQYRKQLKRHFSFQYPTDHWLVNNTKKSSSLQKDFKFSFDQNTKPKPRLRLSTLVRSIMTLKKLHRFIEKKNGRFIRNQTFFPKNKEEVDHFRRFSSFSQNQQPDLKMDQLLQDSSVFLQNSLKGIENVPQTKQQKLNYLYYNIAKYVIESNEKSIDFYFQQQINQSQTDQRKRTISFTQRKLKKSDKNVQEFEIPEIDENDEEFADVNYYNSLLNINNTKEIDQEQIFRIRKSISKRQSRARGFSQVTSILGTLQEEDFMISKIKYFNLNNMIRKAKLIQNQTKLHKILEKKNRTLSIKKGNMNIQNQQFYMIKPEIIEFQNDEQIKNYKDEKKDKNIFKDDSFSNNKSVQIQNILNKTEEYSDPSLQDKSVKSFVLVRDINSFRSQLILKEYCRFNYSKNLRIGKNIGQKRKN